MSGTPGQLYSLQQGRGLAAMAVVLFHLSLMMGLPRYLGHPLFSEYTWRGNLGVDFFFVLSGFIIIFAHHRDIGRPDRLRNYVERRFVRLFPVYWLYAGIFCALVALGFGSNATLPETATQWLSTIFLIRLDKFTFPIAPAWTLVHELAFYLVFALLIIRGRLGMMVFGLWMLVCLLLREYPEYHDQTPWTTYFSPLNLNFLIGMLAWLSWSYGRPVIVKWALPAGLLLIALFYALESREASYSQVQLGYAAGFGLIIAGAAALEAAGQWPSRMRLLNLIGDASYSIYLTHLAVLGVVGRLVFRIAEYVPAPPVLLYLLVFAGTVACGCLAHVWIERPLIAACRKRLSRKSPLMVQRAE